MPIPNRSTPRRILTVAEILEDLADDLVSRRTWDEGRLRARTTSASSASSTRTANCTPATPGMSSCAKCMRKPVGRETFTLVSCVRCVACKAAYLAS